YGINAKGLVAGYYYRNYRVHGFLRSPKGKLATFNAPHSGDATQFYAMNDNDLIAGFSTDGQNHARGFILTP
ncbi:MAG TPA: hypothetical protein VHY79_15605, partial [Rhizomicrobium sp.]|nr:hypothetical protein [Rhizomicrobium sp.]